LQRLVSPVYTWEIESSIARPLCPGKGFVFNAVLIQKIPYGREASSLTKNDPYVLVSNDPEDAQLISWQSRGVGRWSIAA
jgi:hypothetical protein